MDLSTITAQSWITPLARGNPVQKVEMVDLIGVGNGVETQLGRVPMPPEIKAKDIVRSYLVGDPSDLDSEAGMAMCAIMDLLGWMRKNGWDHGLVSNQARPDVAR